jgi:hypothetical protein
MFPARVWQRAPSFWSGCSVDTATLRLLFLKQLLCLRVIQGARAGLDGHCVCLHAHMIPQKAPPGAAQLLEVIPLSIVPRQEADSLHNLDLLLGVAVVRPTLGWKVGTHG